MRTLFLMHSEVPISLAIGPDYSVYNVAVRGLLVLSTVSMLPSQPKSVPIYTPGLRAGREEQVRVKCLAQGQNTWAHTGFELRSLGP